MKALDAAESTAREITLVFSSKVKHYTLFAEALVDINQEVLCAINEK